MFVSGMSNPSINQRVCIGCCCVDISAVSMTILPAATGPSTSTASTGNMASVASASVCIEYSLLVAS